MTWVVVIFAALVLGAAITVVVLLGRKSAENADLRVQIAELKTEDERWRRLARDQFAEITRLGGALKGVRDELDRLESDVLDRGDGHGFLDRLRRRLSETSV